MIVGTAPIHLASDEEAMSNVNKPQLIYTYSEVVQLFGYSRDWEKYTLCEFILGGRVEFQRTENALTDLMNGILRFHIYVTSPPPAEQIVGIPEFDPEDFLKLYDHITNNLDLYSAMQYYNADTGEYEVIQFHVYVKAITKSSNPGNLVVGDGMDTQTEFEVVYMKIDRDD